MCHWFVKRLQQYHFNTQESLEGQKICLRRSRLTGKKLSLCSVRWTDQKMYLIL